MADDIQRIGLETRDGNRLELFYNATSGLIVLDLISAKETGGTELYRHAVNEQAALAHCLDELPNDDEPQEGDYIIADARRGGESVSEFGGRHLGDFADREEAEQFIRERGHREGFFPTVWALSDHGNYQVADFKWD